ncbi:alpha-amylase [Anaerobacillus alkalidiazotrophicus]|uniref:Alpha-amylase n=1 Tax=Anaerobacillus alkalidiazotrophicus TaxID=472963 RepID=A0A1S2MF11_9BACI|nr:alpha-amylase family glycosyl hydrolase [Anaerobacillus alkalidiazotrophicus]OIJ22275.1 alpha-amylase [Anaerobacillus alkalidiazotrophicus]
MLKKKKRLVLTVVLAVIFLLVGCSDKTNNQITFERGNLKTIEPHGVYYEIFIRAFYDSTGDGIGDFKGATSKLDYLQELGVEGIWLMPINPSPSYHGYDVIDYMDVNPEHGTLDDFKEFIEEAHKRGIKVIKDFVINHSSREHPWFQAALKNDEKYRDFYVWADEDTNTSQRGEWGQQVWHGTGNNIYEGVFWDGMPDLNIDHPKVREEIYKIGKFWLGEVGVDGFRLDAAKHIYSSYHGSDYQEKNHQFWREFRSEMEEVNPEVILVGEIWDTATVVAPYLDGGLQSAFNFDLSDKILASVRSEADAGLVTELERTRNYFNKMSEDFIDSTFITNHDMNRVMSELNNNMNHAKMAAALLLTLPGNPYIYYGEEIGMLGKKPDEDIRLPMRWYEDPKGVGQTTWRIDRYHSSENGIDVETQMQDENSLLNYYKELIYARRSSEALIAGEIKSTRISERGILSFKRATDNEEKLVVHNLTSEIKVIDLEGDLSKYQKYFFYIGNIEEIELNSNVLKIPAYTTVILQK